MKRKLAYAFATCGVGLFPKAPGTCGSAFAAVIAYLYPSFFFLFCLLAISVFAGIPAIKILTKKTSDKDPGFIVIDEVAGQTLTYLIFMLFYSHLPFWAILFGFLFFRFFDITKVWPACFFDRRHTPANVMWDDLVAGGYAGLLLSVSFLLF